MELCIKLVTRPSPGTRARVLVLVIVILVAVLAIWRAGYEPATGIPLALSAGLACTQVARALLGNATPAGLAAPNPAPEPGGDCR